MIIVFIKVRTFKNELQLKILNALQVYHAPFFKKSRLISTNFAITFPYLEEKVRSSASAYHLQISFPVIFASLSKWRTSIVMFCFGDDSFKPKKGRLKKLGT